jgi:hypothetical protein
MNEIDIYYDEIKVLGNNNLFYIGIPRKLIKGAGYKKGDKVKVMITKTEQETEEQ